MLMDRGGAKCPVLRTSVAYLRASIVNIDDDAVEALKYQHSKRIVIQTGVIHSGLDNYHGLSVSTALRVRSRVRGSEGRPSVLNN